MTRAQVPSPFEPREAAYQSYALDEERDRLNFHYEKPVEFMTTVTGDPWHVYSCTRWAGEPTVAESQEAKLDEVAALLEMKPGHRILDVGAGWGGPLAYFCLRYGVEGVGITPAPNQVEFATKRMAELGASAEVLEDLWQEYDDEDGFDLIRSDEVAVHFKDLAGYFRRMRRLLRPGGRLITSELHYSHPSHVASLSRGQKLINEIFGSTGNYRTIAEELALAYEADLELVSLTQVPLRHYRRTIDGWLANMQASKERLIELVGGEYYRAFRAYLSLAKRTVAGGSMTLDMIVVKRLGDD